jgi:hypothetical protein
MDEEEAGGRTSERAIGYSDDDGASVPSAAPIPRSLRG